jgi:uncharacterized protein (DUF1697 family)
MPFHVAFLRGMNVGGHRIANPELAAEFERLGFESVTTYRASGNVIFESPGRVEGELVAEIEEGLAESFGYAVPTFVRDVGEVRSIADFDPFDLELVASSKGKLQVSLLAKEPTKEQRDEVRSASTDDDRLLITERELYWLPRGGLMESDLGMDAFEGVLGPSTMRTKGTIEGIAAKIPR